jgi:hypothetical protein
MSIKTSDMAADGEIVWSWRSDAGAKFAKMLTRLAGDGGNQAWSPGRSRISRKTIAQGRPDDPLSPVVLPRAFFLHADHGCGRHPVFPAPSVSWRDMFQSSSGVMCRENAAACPIRRYRCAMSLGCRLARLSSFEVGEKLILFARRVSPGGGCSGLFVIPLSFEYVRYVTWEVTL